MSIYIRKILTTHTATTLLVSYSANGTNDKSLNLSPKMENIASK